MLPKPPMPLGRALMLLGGGAGKGRARKGRAAPAASAHAAREHAANKSLQVCFIVALPFSLFSPRTPGRYD